MSYGLEAYADDELRVYADALDNDRWAFEIRRVRPSEGDKETLVVRSIITAPALTKQA